MSTGRRRAVRLHNPERQMKIVGFVHANGSVKTSDLVTRFHISRQAAVKERSQMVKAGLLERQGIRRGAMYVMK